MCVSVCLCGWVGGCMGGWGLVVMVVVAVVVAVV